MHNFDELEKILGIRFNNPQILKEALTHRSYLNETRNQKLSSNERLEFLGDAVLNLVISELLFKKFPTYSEGYLTNLRSNIVKSESLAKVAKKLKIGNYLYLSKGERKSGGQNNPVLLANALEAIIGALFLDQGLKITQNLIYQKFNNLLKKTVKMGKLKDYKSLLQEKFQAKNKTSPLYKILKETGPDHAKIFTVGVFFKNKLLAWGKGKSKQQAEEETARKALEKLKF